MKAVILAGGLGTRLSEETEFKPKPMLEIGGMPILWHIMKIYSHYGINDFVICLGYKGHSIREFFANYFLHTSDVTFDLKANKMEIHRNRAEPWRVTLIDTGLETMTGGRIKRIQEHVQGETFLMTYGDGVADVDIRKLVDAHRKSGKLCTVTATQPPGRFGTFSLNAQGEVAAFVEKPPGDNSWINGGFFVLEPKIFDYIQGDTSIWEQEPLKNLAHEGKVGVHLHNGFWLPMDTLRDRRKLEDLWAGGKAPWKVWKD